MSNDEQTVADMVRELQGRKAPRQVDPETATPADHIDVDRGDAVYETDTDNKEQSK